MENYLLFLLVAAITILSPGPGVVLTLSNAIQYGIAGSIGGILGIALGTFIVAGISATGLGIILATSTLAFSILKYIGAAYLIYLGVKLWRSPKIHINTLPNSPQKKSLRLFEGLALQVTNPKAVFFFMSIFPQFINFASNNIEQFITLVITYSSLVIIIHLFYAYLAVAAKTWITSDKGACLVNKLGGATFMLFFFFFSTSNK